MLNNLTIFVVNMKQDTEKREYISNQIKSLGLTPTFIEAVDGRTLSEKDINQVYSETQAIKDLKRPLTRGEIGCALSHINICRKVLELNLEFTLVLEDDIIFVEGFRIALKSLLRKLPQKWDTILLGHHDAVSWTSYPTSSFYQKTKVFKEHCLCRIIQPSFGTYGFLLSNSGAKKIIERTNKLSKPIDHYTGNNKEVNLFTVLPPLILVHEEFEKQSVIAIERVEVCKKISNETKKITSNESHQRKRELMVLLKRLFPFGLLKKMRKC